MNGTQSSTPDTRDLLASAGAALARQDWAEARELYEAALADGEGAEALEGLAIARWWEDDVGAAIAARERAYVLRRDAGQTLEAARVAGFLAWDYGAMRGRSAVANGWLQRARRLADELPRSAEHAWLPLIEASFHLDTSPSEVLRLSTEAAELAGPMGGVDIEMTARTLQGLALVSLGRVDEGTRLLDEGTAAATAGELHDPIAIGSCCCNMIIACERARDFDRAGQWCEQLAAFCERTGQRPLLALCRAHHGVVLTMRGDWAEAERELEWAAGELSVLRPPLAGYARARLADLRRRQGNDRRARQALAETPRHLLTELVRASLAMDDNDPSAALGHAEKYMRSLGGDQPIEIAAALELLVPISIRLGDLDRARQACADLAVVAAAVGTGALAAGERFAAGLIAAAEHDADAARRAFEDAIDLYERASMPFEAAHARVSLAQTLSGEERQKEAREQALAALEVFAQLGATRATRATEKQVARLGGRSTAAQRAGLTSREVEVLSLAAQGLSNRAIAKQLVVSEHTVHRHMSNIFTRLGVSSRAAAVARAAERDLLA